MVHLLNGHRLHHLYLSYIYYEGLIHAHTCRFPKLPIFVRAVATTRLEPAIHDDLKWLSPRFIDAEVFLHPTPSCLLIDRAQSSRNPCALTPGLTTTRASFVLDLTGSSCSHNALEDMHT